MSLATWKAAFYPEEASAAAERGELAAVDHCIRKWEGATPENLAAHEIGHVGSGVGVSGFEVFTFNGITCALCHTSQLVCKMCPLADARGGVSCDCGDDPYGVFCGKRGDPEPMLRDLRKARELIQIREAANAKAL